MVTRERIQPHQASVEETGVTCFKGEPAPSEIVPEIPDSVMAFYRCLFAELEQRRPQAAEEAA